MPGRRGGPGPGRRSGTDLAYGGLAGGGEANIWPGRRLWVGVSVEKKKELQRKLRLVSVEKKKVRKELAREKSVGEIRTLRFTEKTEI
jgi:hypothetical protein